MRLRWFACAALAAAALGCGEDAPAPTATAKPKAPASSRAAPSAQGEVAVPAAELPPPVDFQEAAFVESDRSRDPFRNYARAFVQDARGAVRSQRDVLLEEYAVEELKLIALVTGSEPELAMLLDPAGVGHVVKRGQFIGRATVVQPSGGVGAAYEVNWRVDRIRDGDLVLVRDDPSNPDVPSASRVIPLRTDELTAGGEGEKGEKELRSQLDDLKQRLADMEAAEARQRPTSASTRAENR